MKALPAASMLHEALGSRLLALGSGFLQSPEPRAQSPEPRAQSPEPRARECPPPCHNPRAPLARQHDGGRSHDVAPFISSSATHRHGQRRGSADHAGDGAAGTPAGEADTCGAGNLLPRALRMAAENAGGRRLGRLEARRGHQAGDRQRESCDEGSHGGSREHVRRARAVRYAHRSRQGARRAERHHRAPRPDRRGVGRDDARRHDLQRDEELPVDGGRSRVAKGAHPRRHRSREGLHAARRRPLRGAAQFQNHVGAPAATDQRLAGHAVGQTRLGGSSRRRDARGLGRTGN